ncbi:MAG: DNA protecting protein DprA [Acidobacteria bacterium RIFCSPLOWO2_12_FULL_67_14b]|nr:MAG: DNA protecting protein DprA [Acidobacteria bacterium RIFCSPLOWO2_12_FULL_67_14b]
MQTIRLGSPSFPPLLAQIPDPPDELWVRGDLSICLKPAIAVVGARAASRNGLAMAAAIAGDLARAGVVVVSGLARGIDSAAHAGALAAGGLTVAVLGTGIDVVYPAEHRELSERIALSGLLVTEFSPGAPPEVFHFPRRNRIISGLSRAVVVIEAAERSGSLITARLAADQGRDVMVVPGPVLGGRNRGAHALIRDGAKLVESAVDILQELGLDQSLARRSPEGEGGELVEFTVDDIAKQLKLGPGEALARLLEWELTGEIQRIGSGRFVRSRGKV